MTVRALSWDLINTIMDIIDLLPKLYQFSHKIGSPCHTSLIRFQISWKINLLYKRHLPSVNAHLRAILVKLESVG